MKTNQFTQVSICLLAIGVFIAGYPKREEKYERLVSELLPKTVTIYVRVSLDDPETNQKRFGTIIGSGVFISSSGYILTAAHLFNHKDYKIEATTIKTYWGDEYGGSYINRDDNKDLALIKIEEKDTPFAHLVDPRNVREGQEVIAIGAPMGLEGSVTTGIISATNRDEINYDMIQMSAAINPGNSGGPLFNLKGELVGINTNIISLDPLFPAWSGLGFSVSASEINKFLTISRRKTVGRLKWR